MPTVDEARQWKGFLSRNWWKALWRNPTCGLKWRSKRSLPLKILGKAKPLYVRVRDLVLFRSLDPELGSWVSFFRIPSPYFWEFFLGTNYFNSWSIGSNFFLKNKIIFNFVKFMAKVRQQIFLDLLLFFVVVGSGIWEIWYPRWKKIRIQDKHPGSAKLR